MEPPLATARVAAGAEPGSLWFPRLLEGWDCVVLRAGEGLDWQFWSVLDALE